MKAFLFATTLFLGAFMASAPAFAYVGPGAGLSLIGAFWALILAIFTAVFFLWHGRSGGSCVSGAATVEPSHRILSVRAAAARRLPERWACLIFLRRCFRYRRPCSRDFFRRSS